MWSVVVPGSTRSARQQATPGAKGTALKVAGSGIAAASGKPAPAVSGASTGLAPRSVNISALQKERPCAASRGTSAASTSLPRATPCRSLHNTRRMSAPGGRTSFLAEGDLTAGRLLILLPPELVCRRTTQRGLAALPRALVSLRQVY